MSCGAPLAGAGKVVLDADDWELAFFNAIPDTKRHEFDPARVLDVKIVVNAGEFLEMLVGAGQELSWHRWERDPAPRRVWGVSIPQLSAEAFDRNPAPIH
ncbi:hypothetical protein GCM10023351_34730 [Microbacterium gilvum]|uniref:Uncharacterized protein n=2 Tax=Microbacterium gilvum TaxID=1336204 RepID=A0ABP9AU36_9MICO